MNKKLAVALSSGAALVLALTGCSDNSEETEAWAKKVCDRVQPEVEKIQEANSSIEKASEEKQSSEEVKKTDSAAFGKISDAYGSLGKAVDKAGPPPVDDGEELHKDAVKELKGLSSQYSDLKDTVDDLDATDQSEFANGLKKLADRLEKLGKNGDQALSKLQSGDIGEAMSEQEGCKRAPESPNASQGA